MVRLPQRITASSLLLVEGEEEARFWDALLAARGRSGIKTLALPGKYGLAGNLAAVMLTPGFDRIRWLGIAQGADDDPRAAFDRIRDALTRANLPVPPQAWVPTSTVPAVVAFVLPDGANPGDLETLVWQSVAGSPAAACVDAYLACLALPGGPGAPRQEWKARVHAYLASRPRPDLRLGEAAQRSELPLDSAAFDRFVSLIP